MAVTYTPIGLAKSPSGAVRNPFFDFGEWMQIAYPLNEGAGENLTDIGLNSYRFGGYAGDLETLRPATPGIYNAAGLLATGFAAGDPWTTEAGRGAILDLTGTKDYYILMMDNATGGGLTFRRGEIVFAFKYPSSAGAIRRLWSSSVFANGTGGMRISLTATDILRFEAAGFPASGANSITFNSPSAITLNVWHIVSVSWNGTHFALYLNDPVTPIVSGDSATDELGWHLPSGEELWYGGGTPVAGLPTNFCDCHLDTPYYFNRDLTTIRRRELFLDLYHGCRRDTASSFANNRTARLCHPNRSGTDVSGQVRAPVIIGGGTAGQEPQVGVKIKMPDDAVWVTKWGTALADPAPLRSVASVTFATADLAGMTAGTRPWIIPLWRIDSADDGEPFAMGLCAPQMMQAPGSKPNIAHFSDGHDGIPAVIGTDRTTRRIAGDEILGSAIAGMTDAGREAAFNLQRTYAHMFHNCEAENFGPLVNGGDYYNLDRCDQNTGNENDDDHPQMWLTIPTVQDNNADLYKCGFCFDCSEHHSGRCGMNHYVYRAGGGSDKPGAWSKQAASALSIFAPMPGAATYATIFGFDSGPSEGGDYDPTADYEPTYDSAGYVDSAAHQYTDSGGGNYRDTYLVHADGVPIFEGAFFAVPWGDSVMRFNDSWGPADPGARNLGDWVLQTGGFQHPETGDIDPRPWKFGPVQEQFNEDVGEYVVDEELELYVFCHTWPSAYDRVLTGGGE